MNRNFIDLDIGKLYITIGARMSSKSKIFGLSALMALNACGDSDKVLINVRNKPLDIGTRTAIQSGIVRRKLDACLNEGLPADDRLFVLGYSSIEADGTGARQVNSIGRVQDCQTYNFVFECGEKATWVIEDKSCGTSLYYSSTRNEERLGECGYTKNGYFQMAVTCSDEDPQLTQRPQDPKNPALSPSIPIEQSPVVDSRDAESSNSANP